MLNMVLTDKAKGGHNPSRQNLFETKLRTKLSRQKKTSSDEQNNNLHCDDITAVRIT